MNSTIPEKITHIYHAADIHFRNLNRHNEYRLVLNKFLSNIKKDNIKDSVIVLAGDIAHAKTEMSPELIAEISWFLSECANLRETIVITGNHDCNLNNNSRLDALTPIIQNMKHPRLHYYKDTGTYQMANLTFTVYSILDNKENWPAGNTITAENNICLFHGPVRKSETDIGFKISSHAFEPEIFDGFDIVLLGDIHRRQLLQSYDKANNKPAMAYPSSILQQNHGELLDNHGYLLWNVESRTYTEHNIHNDYGFLTIDITKGKIPKWVNQEIGTKLPKYPRLRLRFSETEPSDVNKGITQLKKLFKASEVTVTRTDTIGQLRTNLKLNKNIVGNVKDETFQNELIREYLEKNFQLDDSDLDKIGEINKEINTRIDDSNIAENIIWKPKTFNFSNMFSYGENNEIKFDKIRDIVGIFAKNAQGKSSLLDSLLFCLYDTSTRTSNAKNILNNRKNHFQCKFNFEIDGVDYFIERKAKWIRNKSSIKVDVEFWKEGTNGIESLNGNQRRDTNKNIEKYLGKFEDFILTTLSVQGNNSLFIDKSQTERKDTLSQFMGVDIFDKISQIATEQNRDNSTIIRKFKNNDFTSKLVEIDTKLESTSLKFNQLKDKLTVKTKLHDELYAELLRLNSEYVDLKTVNLGIDELRNRRSILNTKINDIKVEKDVIHERMYKLETLQIQLDEIIDGYDEEELEARAKQFQSNKLNLNNHISELEKLNIRKDSLLEKKQHLDSHKYNPTCDVCIENSESIILSKSTVQTQLVELDKLIHDKNDAIQSGKDIEISLGNVKADWVLFKETQDKESKIDRESTNLLSKLTTLESAELTFINQLETQDRFISEYYSNEKQIKKNIALQEEKNKVTDTLTNTKGEIGSTNDLILYTNGQLSSLINQKETIESQINEVKALEKESKLFEYYLNAISINGIPYELIEKAIPMLEGEINNILGQIVDFGMQLEMDGKNINAYMVYDDQKWSLEMCSGMERFISGLAIRVALINVCNLPRPNFLVIDEGFGQLDSDNLNSLYSLFTYLKSQFDFILVISHIDSMRDMVDNTIDIIKENGFSKIKV